jgi:hypothetical protein
LRRVFVRFGGDQLSPIYLVVNDPSLIIKYQGGFDTLKASSIAYQRLANDKSPFVTRI